MLEVLTEILDTNVDFKIVFYITGFYLVALWLVFSFWVLIDAQKRYERLYISIPLFVFVLFFNFPALIFYLIVRPDLIEEDILSMYSTNDMSGGVNVPIVNFLGENGVELSLQLKINNKKLLINDGNKMNVNVSWDSNNAEYEIKDQKEVDVETQPVTADSQGQQTVNLGSKFSQTFKKLGSNINKIKTLKPKLPKRETIVEDNVSVVTTQEEVTVEVPQEATNDETVSEVSSKIEKKQNKKNK